MRCEALASLRIHLLIFSSATGDIVSSIVEYSPGAPVFAVWKRWFNPGSSSTSKYLFPPSTSAFRMAGRFCAGGTCRSFSPLSASDRDTVGGLIDAVERRVEASALRFADVQHKTQLCLPCV